jgi:hypothetical protein
MLMNIVVGSIASAAALASFPAIAPEDDPILIAAIERHRSACEVFKAIMNEESLLREAIGSDGDDDPRWQELRRRYELISDEMDEAGLRMCEAPASLAGFVALFDYFDEWLKTMCNGTWGDAWGLPETDEIVDAVGFALRRLAVPKPSERARSNEEEDEDKRIEPRAFEEVCKQLEEGIRDELKGIVTVTGATA